LKSATAAQLRVLLLEFLIANSITGLAQDLLNHQFALRQVLEAPVSMAFATFSFSKL
jgi:hypothetical protein